MFCLEVIAGSDADIVTWEFDLLLLHHVKAGVTGSLMCASTPRTPAPASAFCMLQSATPFTRSARAHAHLRATCSPIAHMHTFAMPSALNDPRALARIRADPSSSGPRAPAQ
jgi:hypothetical protein